MKYPVSFFLNGMPVDAYVKPTETLLDVIRERLNIKSPSGDVTQVIAALARSCWRANRFEPVLPSP